MSACSCGKKLTEVPYTPLAAIESAAEVLLLAAEKAAETAPEASGGANPKESP